jgi:hypothetical protein
MVLDHKLKGNNMSKNIEDNLLASKWKFAKKILGNDVYGKFRNMQIDAYSLEIALNNRGIIINKLDYFSDKKSTFLEVSIANDSVEFFYSDSRCIWNIPKENMPTHRNDYWNDKRQSPEVSTIYRDVSNANLVLTIKFNPNSKRYFYPTPEELSLNDSLVIGKSQKYYEAFLK